MERITRSGKRLVYHYDSLMALAGVAVSTGVRLQRHPASLRRPSTRKTKPQKIDACSLATREEVGAIQGAKMLDPKNSEGPETDFVLSQCYYSSAEPDKSVSLGLMQRNPSGSRHTYYHPVLARNV